MKGIKKKLLTTIMAMSMVLPCGGKIFADTTQQGKYVALGDSISTGYKLENKEVDSFTSKLAKEYNKQLINLAVDGMDTTSLLKMLKSTDPSLNAAKESLKSADMITLTIGGNHLLRPLMTTIKQALDLKDTKTTKEVQKSLLMDKEVLVKIYRQFENPETTKLFESELTNFAVEFPQIIQNIKALNSNATMVVQTVYNPFDKSTELSQISPIADGFIQKLNQIIVSASSNTYKVADIYTAFKSDTSNVALTNIASLDIHPNKYGHQLIFDVHKQILGAKDSFFNDTNNHWAKDSIDKFASKGYVVGYGDKTFKPENSMTRAEFVSMFNRVFGLTKTSGKVFNDTANHWAKEQIDIAVTNGVANGVSSTEFKPDDFITREQVAMMISNYKKLSDSNHDKVKQFSDASDISKWSIDAVEGIVENKYMIGYEDNSFKPLKNITRAEAVVTLSRVS